jgi:hypothetical protein
MEPRKRGVLSDPELIEQFSDDPEALALLDAIAATQDPTLPRRGIAAGRSFRSRLHSPRGGRRGSGQRVGPGRSVALISACVVVLTVVVGASAFAVARRLVIFGHTPSAHGLIVRDFSDLPRVAGVRGPGRLTAPPRRVYAFSVNKRVFALYAAPARDGFCWGVSALGITCVTPHSPAIEPLYSDIPRRGDREPALIAGAVRGRPDRVVLTFKDESQTDLDLVFVSSPISASFFLYRVPPDRWAQGVRPKVITVFNSENQVAGRGYLLYETAR